MLKLAPFAVAAFVMAGPAKAQHMNAADAPCLAAGTTLEMVTCLSAALESREEQLTKLLTAIRAVTEGDERRLLDAAQVAWVDFRRFSCDAEYALYSGGSGGSPARLACLDAITRARINQLHQTYDWRIEKRR